MQNSVGQQNIAQAVPNIKYQTAPSQPDVQYQPQMCQPCQVSEQIQSVQPQYAQAPIQSASAPQGQNVSVPNYSGVNIQIFNPSVTPPGATAPVYNVNAPSYGTNTASGCYPSGYYTNNWGQNGNANRLVSQNNTNQTTSSDKKTEKREVVQLTDEYIKNLENYLNSQDKEVRMMGAKEVVARLEEDNKRKDDKALNALINKMLQDPYTPVRVLAMSALNSRIVTGDELTVNILQQMQNSASGYGQDALQASEVLLKMSGQKVEKEVEVKNTTKKTETKTENKTQNQSQVQNQQ